MFVCGGASTCLSVCFGVAERRAEALALREAVATPAPRRRRRRAVAAAEARRPAAPTAGRLRGPERLAEAGLDLRQLRRAQRRQQPVDAERVPARPEASP